MNHRSSTDGRYTTLSNFSQDGSKTGVVGPADGDDDDDDANFDQTSHTAC